MSELGDVTVTAEATEQQLNPRELADYRDYKRQMLQWFLHFGKEPEQAEGYAEATVSQITYNIDKFYRWLWTEEERYTTQATPAHASEYMKQVIYEDHSDGHKATVQKCLQRLFKYRRHEFDEDVEWEPEYTFSESASQPKDYLTLDERQAIRDAAMEYGSIPSYNSLGPRERDEWKAYLAQRFEKPKDDIGEEDWKRANGWKIPSLVWTSLDAGLRPIEVERARVSWVDVENKMLRIPKEESSKNEGNWSVALTERTATALERWLGERSLYEQYEDTDALWLTKYGNPYQSQALRRILQRLCDIAGIDAENRRMSWYTIRHSVGTYMTREEDLAAAQAQLRHKSAQTTMRYDQTPVEDRRSALDKMG